jgi:hypothetical protein
MSKNIFKEIKFEEYIENVLKTILQRLNSKELKILTNYVYNIIQIIYIKFNIEQKYVNLYINKLKENNNRDIIAITFMLLPYVDDKNDFELFKKISQFNDIYVKQKDNKNPDDPYLYEISNIQYNRCVRKNKNNKIDTEEIKFELKHLEHNYYLLCRTLDRISNKLYVNWITTIPITLEDYEQTNVYTSSINAYNNKEIGMWVKLSDINTLRHLYIGDIYDTIYNYLYIEIKRHKWLLFEDIIDDENKLYIEILNSIFPLNNIIEGKKWLLLDNDDIKTLKTKWTSFINAIQNNTSIKTPIGKIPNNIIIQLFKQLILYFENKSSTKYLEEIIENNLYIPLEKHIEIKEQVKKITKSIDDEDDEDEKNDNEQEITINQLQEIDIKYFIESTKNLPVEEIYNFLYNTIKHLKKTWYGQFLFFNNKINRNMDLYKDTFQNNLKQNPISDIYTYNLSLKNIYNFAKSFVHADSWKLLPKKFIMLNLNEQMLIQNRLNNIQNNDWFSISRNLKNLYVNLGTGDIKNLNLIIFNTIHQNIIDIVFRCLIHKGILTKFHFHPELTNLSLIPSNFNDMKNHYTKYLYELVFNKFNRKKYENTNYYLTTEPYKNLQKIRVEKSQIQSYLPYIDYEDIEGSADFGQQLTDIPYFDSIATTDAWYKFYAMDWICQINFFHHYINNSIMFITGATGQGKSTQMPKLFLYALKMVDYNSEGKVVCTQPRIPPTIENSDEISKQMGVPIFMPAGNQEGKIKTTNYYVQFAYQEDQHMNDSEEYFLRIVTDGKLIEELNRNLVLKVKKPKKKSKHKDELLLYKKFTYGSKNVYDIIMVDESHEHNTNMDLILTLGRNSLLYNNSLKLIIVSATIDQDEPKYRRYYRDINDNLIYPYTYELELVKLDRANVDRRFHIAPPGSTTQFKITDIFLNTPGDNNKNMTEAYESNAIVAVDTVQKICATEPDGQILVFSIGRKEIENMIKQLLKKTPENVLIIPYLAEVKESWKNKMTKIGRFLPSIDFDRNNIMDVVFSDEVPAFVPRVNRGKYTRAIIIATPIAEASITIENLKFVVDTGFMKSGTYNVQLGVQDLNTTKITESSRIQRRGRVGRVSDGTVYYTYSNVGRKYIVPEYKICNDDIKQNLFKLIASSKNNPLIKEFLFESSWFKEQNFYYDKNEELLFRGIYFDEFSSKMRNELPQYYTDGFNIEDIFDVNGKFYIIHPRENLAKRNELTGEVISTYRTDKRAWIEDVSIMNILDIKLMIDSLNYSQRIVDLNVFDEVDYLSEHTEKLGFIFNEYKKMKINKTNISFSIDDIMKDTSTEINYEMILTLLYSIKYGVYMDVLIIMIFLLSSGFNMSNLYGTKIGPKGFPIKMYDEFQKVYSYDDNKNTLNSDYFVFLKIYNLIKKSFPDLVLFKEKLDMKEILNDFDNDRLEFIYIKNKQKNPNVIPKDYSVKKYNKYNNFLYNNILNNENGRNKIIRDSKKQNKYIDKLFEQLKENKENMKKWCNDNYLNYDTINKFLVNYFYYETIFLSLYEKMKKLADTLSIESFDDNENNNETKIIKSFFQANGRSIKLAYFLKYDNNTKQPYFYMVNQTDIHLIGTSKSLTQKRFLNETILKNYSDIIMYNNIQIKKDRDDYENETEDGPVKPTQNMVELGILSKINKDWLTLMLPNIFNKKVTRASNTKYEIVNKIGLEVLNKLNVNNISYLVDTSDNILKKYYTEFMIKIREYIGGSVKLKSFNVNKLKYNNKLLQIIQNNNKYNILNIVDRIYIRENNNIVSEIYGKTYNNIYYKFL